MYKEIDLGNNNSLVLFHYEEFWNKIIPHNFEDSERIDIITYNFNFIHKNGRSFYNKLKKLSEKGVDIRLLYAKNTYSNSDNIEIEEIFKQSILCANLPENHAKIFISDTIAFIGSANFSIGSNNNYECGTIIRDIDTIEKIRREFITQLLEVSEFTNIPHSVHNDPMNHVLWVEDAINKINSIISEKKNLENAESMDLISKLRFYDDIKDIAEKLGISFSHGFDLYGILLRPYEEEYLTYEEYNLFKDYICKLETVIKKMKNYLIKSYDENGRINTLKELDRYFEANLF